MKFRLKPDVGTHRENSGRVYKAGEIVESDQDLIKLFPEKFSRVGASKDEDDESNRVVLDDGTNKTVEPESDLAERQTGKQAVPEDEDEEWGAATTKKKKKTSR